jgi:hypothetical protein
VLAAISRFQALFLARDFMHFAAETYREMGKWHDVGFPVPTELQISVRSRRAGFDA